jgi:hypothetical protein
MAEKCSAFALRNKILPGLLSILSDMVPQWRMKMRSTANRIEYGASPAAEFVLYIRQSLRMIDLELGL